MNLGGAKCRWSAVQRSAVREAAVEPGAPVLPHCSTAAAPPQPDVFSAHTVLIARA